MNNETRKAIAMLKRAAQTAPAEEFFGDRLRRLRVSEGLSLDDLACRTEITRGYLWKLETGRSVNPGLVQIRKLAKALDVTPGYLADSEL
jgi:transcriptional regulator with XRE-family HTH domain